MQNISKITICLSMLLGTVIATDSVPASMTELQILTYKDRLQKNLLKSVFEPAEFSEYYTQYHAFCCQKDPIIEKALKVRFKEAMTQQLEKRAELKAQIKEYGITQSTKGEKVLTGLGACAGSIAIGAFGVWALNEAIKSPYLDDGDAMIPFVFLAAIGLGVAGISEIADGLSDNQAKLNIINNIIAILDANYTYAFPNEEKLSTQIKSK